MLRYLLYLLSVQFMESSLLFCFHQVLMSVKVVGQQYRGCQRYKQLSFNLMARYWDSWGKPSDGILTGHTTFLGYYDECINLKNTDLSDMRYCIYPMVMGTIIMQRSLALKALGGLKIFSNFVMSYFTYISLSCFILRILICNSFPHGFFFS